MQADTLKSNDTFSVGIITYLITCGLVLLLMMLAGSFMRMAQGQIINIAPDIFLSINDSSWRGHGWYRRFKRRDNHVAFFE